MIRLGQAVAAPVMRANGYALAASQWSFALVTLPPALACAGTIRAGQIASARLTSLIT